VFGLPIVRFRKLREMASVVERSVQRAQIGSVALLPAPSLIDGATRVNAHEHVEVLATQSRISHFQFAMSALVGGLLNPCTRGSFPGCRNRRAGVHEWSWDKCSDGVISKGDEDVSAKR